MGNRLSFEEKIKKKVLKTFPTVMKKLERRTKKNHVNDLECRVGLARGNTNVILHNWYFDDRISRNTGMTKNQMIRKTREEIIPELRLKIRDKFDIGFTSRYESVIVDHDRKCRYLMCAIYAFYS